VFQKIKYLLKSIKRFRPIIVTESILAEKGVKPLIDFYVKEYNILKLLEHLTVIANYEDNTIAVIKVKGPEEKSFKRSKRTNYCRLSELS
jgi:hypothetical protein